MMALVFLDETLAAMIPIVVTEPIATQECVKIVIFALKMKIARS